MQNIIYKITSLRVYIIHIAAALCVLLLLGKKQQQQQQRYLTCYYK